MADIDDFLQTSSVVLVCGGRRYRDYDTVRRWLLNLLPRNPVILEGGAPGADSLARRFASEHGLQQITEKADWSLGAQAGPARNQRMLDTHPVALCLAFPGSRGTADMVARCQQQGVPVVGPEHTPDTHMCPHCAERLAPCDLTPVHDWPKPLRQVCPGSHQTPRRLSGRRPLPAAR